MWTADIFWYTSIFFFSIYVKCRLLVMMIRYAFFELGNFDRTQGHTTHAHSLGTIYSHLKNILSI